MFPLESFLIGVGVACAISTGLALLVVLADATVGNYGRAKISINGEKEIEVDGGRPLLGALMDEGIFIPSACGGRGSCGFCKLKVESGGGDLLPTELPWLDEAERASQVRLSCQLKVKGEMALRIPEELFKVRRYTGEVVELADLTHDIKLLTVRLPGGETLPFRAGQFMQIEVPEYELTDEPVYRAYSIASPPQVTDHVSFMIRLVPNGICTTYVHRHLALGDLVCMNGPYGDFLLRETTREIICIAGGSGMAPIKSILADMQAAGNRRRTRYFFGAVTKRDLYEIDAMAAFEKNLADFRFIPALSAPLPEDDWHGETGLVTEVVARHLESGENVEAYLCGSPGMINACITVLEAKGVPRELIYFDSFG